MVTRFWLCFFGLGVFIVEGFWLLILCKPFALYKIYICLMVRCLCHVEYI
jgi:hypothetical protein